MRRRLGWQPVNDHRSVCAKRWLLVREDVAKCAANLIAICTVVLRQTWQYGVNRRCVPPFFFCSLPPNSTQQRSLDQFRVFSNHYNYYEVKKGDEVIDGHKTSSVNLTVSNRLTWPWLRTGDCICKGESAFAPCISGVYPPWRHAPRH